MKHTGFQGGLRGISYRAVLCFVLLLAGLLTGCADRPYFVIANNSSQTVRIEMVYDSLNISEIVANDIIVKSPPFRDDDWRIPQHDSLRRALLTPSGKEFAAKYLFDSVSLYALTMHDEFQIADLGHVEPDRYGNGRYYLDYGQKAFDYYRRDSSLIGKIVHDNIVTYFLPPGYTFYKGCRSCGDCSCEAQFPRAKEVRIVFGKDDDIRLTEKNFRRIMKKEEFNHQDDSYIFTIESEA